MLKFTKVENCVNFLRHEDNITVWLLNHKLFCFRHCCHFHEDLHIELAKGALIFKKCLSAKRYHEGE